MDWMQGIQNAIDYIEVHITENIRYEEVARKAHYSSYHFQRMFGIMCGITLGEYIRRRRLTLAGSEMAVKKVKVTDIALKYGYDTPESFSRAFYKFHGIKPSQVKNGCSLNSFSRISVKTDFVGGKEMNYKIAELPELTLVGFKKRFVGVPYVGEEDAKQEEAFVKSTRAKQWLLLGASCDYSTDYRIITNISDDGYDCYLAYELDEPTRKDLFDPEVTGVDFIGKLGFETIVVPQRLCAVFATDKKKRPVSDYVEMRKRILSEWLPSSGYVIADVPETVIYHWRPKGEWDKERYIEICLPIENKTDNVK